MASEINSISCQYVNLLLNGLKFAEGMSFSNTNKLHNNDMNYGSVVIYVTKVLNGDLQLLYTDTLLEANGGFIEWVSSQIANHIQTPIKEIFLYKCLECKY